METYGPFELSVYQVTVGPRQGHYYWELCIGRTLVRRSVDTWPEETQAREEGRKDILGWFLRICNLMHENMMKVKK